MSVPGLQRALTGVDCEVRFDNLTRQLYATDASIYQIEPRGVAFPRDARQASAVIRAAADAGVPLIPRGAGTGLVGGAIGDGLVIEFARFHRPLSDSDLNLERRTVRVGAGVVLDTLNGFLRSHGFCFGPDVATSSRATLGGMIANNSSGARTPVYGTTADHVRALEVVLADGQIKTLCLDRDELPAQSNVVNELVRQHATEIIHRMPPGLRKRWPGYGLDRWLRAPGNLSDILAGSEGTLAAILSAELNIVPLPQEKGLGVIFFASVAEAMQATVELLDLQPAAIEHVDRVLFDQTRGQLAFQPARDLLELDARPCEAFLIVEFYGDVRERLAGLEKKQLGLRTRWVTDNAEMNLVWGLRKAGLSLLTGCPGPAKPVTCIEDTAVRPEQLPAYVAGLRSILDPVGVPACFYGHAASGLLHVRPVLDLHTAEDRRKLRQITTEVSALVRQFQGSFAAEHGVGLARTEFLREHLGDGLLDALRQIKAAFDPRGVFNPGKIIDDGRFKIDTHLRLEPGRELKLPFEPVLAFAAKDHSFVRNLEQCNGCGGCRKETPTMCPTFLATGEEIMSTRGRANAIRAALERRGMEGDDPLRTAELEAALSNCLSCKACTTECPSNVNLALLKAELLYARHRRDGLPLRARIISHVDALGRFGCLTPGWANAALEWRWLRCLLKHALGITDRRPLPRFARERFDHWFARRDRPRPAQRGQVILWDDTFARYYEPNVGQAAVAVLEAAGFEVVLPAGRQCCGRPAFSQGNLGLVQRLGRHNLNLLSSPADPARMSHVQHGNATDCRRRREEAMSRSTQPSPPPYVGAYRGCEISGPGLRTADSPPPILFLEPSCWSMFIEDYRELKLPGAEQIAKRCFLFEQFIEDLLRREPEALRFREQAGHVAIHAHCHAKALVNPAFMLRLAQRLPGRTVELLDTACCGMAGAFGATEEKIELSLQVGRLLEDKVRQQPGGAMIVASGTSCRQQIEHLTTARPRHLAEVLAAALAARIKEKD